MMIVSSLTAAPGWNDPPTCYLKALSSGLNFHFEIPPGLWLKVFPVKLRFA
jgi:hypothetical protein